MTNFKEGDKVICIDDDSGNKNGIKAGQMYEIENSYISDGQTYLILVPGNSGWRPERFVLANSHLIKEKLGIK